MCALLSTSFMNTLFFFSFKTKYQTPTEMRVHTPGK